jgi:DivIVA domain-containing protein
MEVSPKTFREVEFREKMRGYHPEDVDRFLEEMAVGVEGLHERLRVALERAQRAEQRAEQASAEAGSGDETIKRTLVLAQRTADMAVQEARDQASRTLKAQSLVLEAEDRARRLHGEALADVHAELAKLEAIRAQAQQEVDALSRWAEEHRGHLRTTLADALAMVERAGVLTPPPSSSPIEVPFAARRAAVSPALPPAAAIEPPPVQVRPPAEDRRAIAAPELPGTADSSTARPAEQGRTSEPPRPADPEHDGRAEPSTGEVAAVPAADEGRDLLTEPDDEALDSYFDDNDFGDDRRFGGRLRRRR